MKVVVYLRAADEKSLRDENEDPAEWVRQIIRNALNVRRELVRRQATGKPD
jgi:hypothetical protein